MPQETKGRPFDVEEEHAPGVVHENLEGWIPALASEEELRVALEGKSDGPGLVPCYLQSGIPRKLANLTRIRVLDVSAEASYHRVFDSCDAKRIRIARRRIARSRTRLVLDLELEEHAFLLGLKRRRV